MFVICGNYLIERLMVGTQAASLRKVKRFHSIIQSEFDSLPLKQELDNIILNLS